MLIDFGLLCSISQSGYQPLEDSYANLPTLSSTPAVLYNRLYFGNVIYIFLQYSFINMFHGLYMKISQDINHDSMFRLILPMYVDIRCYMLTYLYCHNSHFERKRDGIKEMWYQVEIWLRRTRKHQARKLWSIWDKTCLALDTVHFSVENMSYIFLHFCCPIFNSLDTLSME